MSVFYVFVFLFYDSLIWLHVCVRVVINMIWTEFKHVDTFQAEISMRWDLRNTYNPISYNKVQGKELVACLWISHSNALIHISSFFSVVAIQLNVPMWKPLIMRNSKRVFFTHSQAEWNNCVENVVTVLLLSGHVYTLNQCLFEFDAHVTRC